MANEPGRQAARTYAWVPRHCCFAFVSSGNFANRLNHVSDAGDRGLLSTVKMWDVLLQFALLVNHLRWLQGDRLLTTLRTSAAGGRGRNCVVSAKQCCWRKTSNVGRARRAPRFAVVCPANPAALGESAWSPGCVHARLAPESHDALAPHARLGPQTLLFWLRVSGQHHL